MSNSLSTRAAYTKPTLIEYGSLTKHTKQGFLDPSSPNPDDSFAVHFASAIGDIITSVAVIIS
jgi:hypothetical protein